MKWLMLLFFLNGKSKIVGSKSMILYHVLARWTKMNIFYLGFQPPGRGRRSKVPQTCHFGMVNIARHQRAMVTWGWWLGDGADEIGPNIGCYPRTWWFCLPPQTELASLDGFVLNIYLESCGANEDERYGLHFLHLFTSRHGRHDYLLIFYLHKKHDDHNDNPWECGVTSLRMFGLAVLSFFTPAESSIHVLVSASHCEQQMATAKKCRSL